jgi:hypothetical protein
LGGRPGATRRWRGCAGSSSAREASRPTARGGAEGQAGDGVHGDGAPAAARRADSASDLDCLGGVGEAQAGDGRDLQGPDLDAAVGVLAGAVHHRDLPPRQPGELGVQGWLVGLDDQQVVGAAVDEKAGVVALSGSRGSGGRHGCPSGHEAMRTAWSSTPVPVSRSSGQTTCIGHHGTVPEP